MTELVATGTQPTERWEKSIPEGVTVRIGRAPQQGWAVPWDASISREHADVRWDGARLLVRQLDTARNRIVYHGQPVTECTVSVGDEFTIGTTRFQLHAVADESAVESPAEAPRADVTEQAFRPDDLKRFQFGDADNRLELMSHLPQMIAQSRSDEEFATSLVDLLLRAIPQAEAAAVAEYDAALLAPLPSTHAAQTVDRQAEPPIALDLTKPKMMRWNSRGDVGRFRPSRRLIARVLQRGESILHVWGGAEQESLQFTMSAGLDWAFCAPIQGESCHGWVLYVSGTSESDTAGPDTSEETLKGHLRFTELLAQFIGAIRQVRTLQNRQATMSQFFSPAVVKTLTDARADAVLRPQEGPVTVLFCDVRGFSKQVEQAQNYLQEFLDRVSQALGVMTGAIMKHEGVIADFQGDAALAFWGWPTPRDDGPLAACRAALAIHTEFDRANREPNHPLRGFRVGVAVGHGRAIAGKIGTEQQAKVGVFGPVVNLTARLEGMTKQFGVPILIDESTAEYVRRHLPRSEGRCRRLGRIRPEGIETPLVVTELQLPEGHPGAFTDDQITQFEQAVDAFILGRWSDARVAFDRLPAADGAKDFLVRFAARHDQQPPPGWAGVVALDEK